jgi:predicted transposase YbfD/YdcC
MDGPKSLIEHFSSVQDPRIDRTKKHLLIEIIIMTIVAILCGADDWDEIVLICEGKEKWLRKFLILENGIPCADTFRRVFSRISPQQFEASFVSWTQMASNICRGEIIAIDGKCLRHSHNNVAGKSAIHMVSAWAHDARMVLGQIKVDDKSNEITPIPQLLDVLDIAGCIVTIDAMGCQTAIAEKIISKEGDYVLGLKGNQGNTLEAVKQHFDTQPTKDLSHIKTTTDGSHGRIEDRTYKIFSAAEVADLREWPGLKTIAMVESRTESNTGNISSERRYYLTSLPLNIDKIARAIRGHWGVENSLHWVLDVQMNEDQSRIRTGNAAENIARIRRLTINMLKGHEPRKKRTSTRKKRLSCLMLEGYLAKVVRGAD